MKSSSEERQKNKLQNGHKNKKQEAQQPASPVPSVPLSTMAMKCGGNLLIVTVILLLVVFFTPVVDGGSQPTGRPSRQPTSKPSKVPTPGPTSSPPPIITTLVNINGLPGSTGVPGPAAYALLSRPSDVFIVRPGSRRNVQVRRRVSSWHCDVEQPA